MRAAGWLGFAFDRALSFVFSLQLVFSWGVVDNALAIRLAAGSTDSLEAAIARHSRRTGFRMIAQKHLIATRCFSVFSDSLKIFRLAGFKSTCFPTWVLLNGDVAKNLETSE